MNRTITKTHIKDAARLKALLVKSDFTQCEIAKMLGMTQPTVNQYLNAGIALNLPVILSCAKILGCSVADISPTTVKKYNL